MTVLSKMDVRDPRTVGAYRQQIVERLFSAMLGARFAEIAQKPDAPFLGAGAGRSSFVRTKEVSTLGALVKGDAIDKTIDALFTEAERVARFGFTPAEFERPKQNIMASLERAVREKDNTPAASIAGELARHVTDREPVPGIVYEYELYTRFLPQITLAEVNALAKDWVPDRNRVVTVSAPREGRIRRARRDGAGRRDGVGREQGRQRRTSTRSSAAPLLDPLPAPGAVVKTTAKEAFGITEWELSNGVKVVIKPTDFREDEILVPRRQLRRHVAGERRRLHSGEHCRAAVVGRAGSAASAPSIFRRC